MTRREKVCVTGLAHDLPEGYELQAGLSGQPTHRSGTVKAIKRGEDFAVAIPIQEMDLPVEGQRRQPSHRGNIRSAVGPADHELASPLQDSKTFSQAEARPRKVLEDVLRDDQIGGTRSER